MVVWDDCRDLVNIFLLNYSDGNCAHICDLWELSSVHLVWSVVCCEVLRVIVIVILKSLGRVGSNTVTTQSHHNETSNNNNNTHHSRQAGRGGRLEHWNSPSYIIEVFIKEYSVTGSLWLISWRGTQPIFTKCWKFRVSSLGPPSIFPLEITSLLLNAKHGGKKWGIQTTSYKNL